MMQWTKIKKLLVAVTVTLFCCTMAAQAQEDSLKSSPEMRATKLTEKMKATLGLSDEQYNKAYTINLLYARKNEDIIRGDGSKLSKLKALKAGNDSKNREMKPVLSKEQFEGYKEMQKEMKQHVREAYKDSKP